MFVFCTVSAYNTYQIQGFFHLTEQFVSHKLRHRAAASNISVFEKNYLQYIKNWDCGSLGMAAIRPSLCTERNHRHVYERNALWMNESWMKINEHASVSQLKVFLHANCHQCVWKDEDLKIGAVGHSLWTSIWWSTKTLSSLILKELITFRVSTDG